MISYPEPIETVLQQQRKFHARQIELIDLALAAVQQQPADTQDLPGGRREDKTSSRYQIQWTRHIKELLETYSEFTIVRLQQDLAEEKAIAAAQTPPGRNMIINVLSRLKKKGLVQRISPGVYRVKKEETLSGDPG